MHEMTYDARMETARVHEAPQPPSLDSFGARLAIIRWAQRWNLKEAALACNLPQASWREWELFDRAPRNIVEVAGKIAARTGYDDYWIMTGKQKAPVEDEGRGARPEGFEPPTFCLEVESHLDAAATTSDAVVIDLTDRLSVAPAIDRGIIAPVVELHRDVESVVLPAEPATQVIQLPTWRNQPGILRCGTEVAW